MSSSVLPETHTMAVFGRFSNFLRRQPCYVLGFFPFLSWVIVLIVHIETAKADLAEATNGSLIIPDFVNTLLYGTVVIYSSFSFVMVCDPNPELANAPCYGTTSYMCCCSIRKKQPIFQYLPPGTNSSLEPLLSLQTPPSLHILAHSRHAHTLTHLPALES